MWPIKKKDKVQVIRGDNRGKQGEVVKIFPDDMKVIVSKINIVKKHARPTQTTPGGIKEIELPMHVSNVMLICPKCSQLTRPKFDLLSDGKKIRLCRKCGEMVM